MPAPLALEVFAPDGRGVAEEAAARPETGAAAEEVRLAAYEKGYSAGWEDAATAHAGDQLRIREDLARGLRDLSFTYHEARSHVLRALEPLLTGMVEQVLPGLARQGLGAAVREIVLVEAAEAAGAPLHLVIAPANRAAIEAALEGETALPITLVCEPTFSEGQVHFRIGEEERVFDLDGVLGQIRRLMTDFLATRAEDGARSHG